LEWELAEKGVKQKEDGDGTNSNRLTPAPMTDVAIAVAFTCYSSPARTESKWKQRRWEVRQVQRY
jgi:hypothetical protein